MKAFIIIQARMGSARLPGKVLMPLGGKPAIQWVIERAKRCGEADDVILATTTQSDDDPLEYLCAKLGAKCFRGSMDDVLDRYYSAARHFGANGNDIIVRVTGDCPLIDPQICDAVITALKNSSADYVSNTAPCTFPDGLDCEAMRFSALERSWREAKMKYEREHVTQYILKHPELFLIENCPNGRDLSDMRWTLDEPADYEFLSAVIEGLETDDFHMVDVLSFLDKNPSLSRINSSIARNEGLEKSIREEKL